MLYSHFILVHHIPAYDVLRLVRHVSGHTKPFIMQNFMFVELNLPFSFSSLPWLTQFDWMCVSPQCPTIGRSVMFGKFRFVRLKKCLVMLDFKLDTNSGLLGILCVRGLGLGLWLRVRVNPLHGVIW